MFRFLPKILFFIFLLSFGVYSASGFATSKSTKLKHLITKIHTLESHLKETQKQQGAIQTQLRSSEIAIGKITISIKNTEKKLAIENDILKKLRIKQKYYQQKLSDERDNLGNDVLSAYAVEKSNYIKALLNNEEPNKAKRMNVYYQYIINSRAKNIIIVKSTLEEIRQNDLLIQKQTKILESLYAHQKSGRDELTLLQSKRSAALKVISGSLKTQQSKLKQLISDKQALERLIERINAQAKAAARLTRKSPKISGSINMLRGKLLSPTSGKITNAFGSGDSQLNGVVISAEEGQEVHAVSRGKVVFADWLQGYGLLLIIDHGNGYMSLYGRNHSLYKKTGERVSSGEVIATVGNTGGYENSGLYFAMRYNGKPVDPTVFLE